MFKQRSNLERLAKLYQKSRAATTDYDNGLIDLVKEIMLELDELRLTSPGSLDVMMCKLGSALGLGGTYRQVARMIAVLLVGDKATIKPPGRRQLEIYKDLPHFTDDKKHNMSYFCL